MSFERIIEFEPGYDCVRFECCNGSEKCLLGLGTSHGRHGMQVRWVLKGERGAIQFLLFTHWMPEPEGYGKPPTGPLPADLGYHAKDPQYDGQEVQDDNCPYTGGLCYYDGSGLSAGNAFRVLCNDGGDALWEYLEAVYRSRFDGEPFPQVKPYRFASRQAPLPH